MAETPYAPSIEALLAHAGWLRGLARSLGEDEAAADDAVQDAWLAALRDGGAVASPRGWLASVLRNTLRRGARRGSLRRAAEQDSARREASGSGADEDARVSRQRLLCEEIERLPAASRNLIVWRHFDGLSPRQIAKRLGVGSDAARARLKRALDQLRERLDRRFGGERRAWVLGLVPLALSRVAAPAAVAAGASATAGKGGIVSPLLKIAALVLVVAGGTWVWNRAVERTPGEDTRAVVARGTKPPSADPGRAGDAAGTEIRSVPLRPEEAPRAREPEPEVIERPTLGGRVVSDDGRPVHLARIVLRKHGEAAAIARTHSGEDGSWSLQVGASINYRIEAAKLGLGSAVREDVRAGEKGSQHLADLVLTAPGWIAGTVVRPDGAPVEGYAVEARIVGEGSSIPRERPKDGDQPPERVEAGMGFDVGLATSDASGRFRIGGLEHGRYAVGPAGEKAETWTTFARTGDSDVRLVLQTPRIRVRVVDLEGKPASSAHVIVRSFNADTTAAWSEENQFAYAHMTADGDGRCIVEVEPDTRVVLAAWTDEETWSGESQVMVRASAPEPEVELKLVRARAKGGVRIALRDERGEPLRAVIQLRRLMTHAIHEPKDRESHPVVFQGLEPDRYELTATFGGAFETFYLPLRREVRIPSGAEVSLEERMVPGGRLELKLDAPDGSAGALPELLVLITTPTSSFDGGWFDLRRPGAEITSERFEAGKPVRASDPLAPGSYVLKIRGEGLRDVVRPFTIRAREVERVDVRLERAR